MSVCRRCATLIISAAAVLAQDPRGSITGRITDQSGAIVPNATVRVVNDATQVAARSTTNRSGNFVIPFLIPGTYTITAEGTGFKRFSRAGIQVRISDTVEVNIPLELGSLTETVDVKADAPLLDTATASLGQVVDEKRLLELPLNAATRSSSSILRREWRTLQGPFRLFTRHGPA